MCCTAGRQPGHGKEAVPLADDPLVEQRRLPSRKNCAAWSARTNPFGRFRADLAQDLRPKSEGLIKQGRTDDEIKTFPGQSLWRFRAVPPPVKPSTWLLWAGPFRLAVVGVVGAHVVLAPTQPGPG